MVEDRSKVTVRLHPALREALDLVAESENMTSGELARKFLDEGIARRIVPEYVEKQAGNYSLRLQQLSDRAADAGLLLSPEA